MANIYVSPSGNDTNDGSYASPYQHIHKALDVFASGDTILCFDGTYTDEEGRVFANKTLTIKSVSEDFTKVIIKPKVCFDVVWYGKGWLCMTTNDITIEDVTVDFDYNEITGTAWNTLFTGYFWGGNVTIARSFVIASNWATRPILSQGHYLLGVESIFSIIKCTIKNILYLVHWESNPTATLIMKDSAFDNVFDVYSQSTTIENNNLSYNCQVNFNNKLVDATDLVSVDPQFLSATSALTGSSSPCVDAGIVIPGYVETYFGTAPDIGAYEANPSPSIMDSGESAETVIVNKAHGATTWDIEKYYFDGLGGEIQFDNNANFDAIPGMAMNIEMTMESVLTGTVRSLDDLSGIEVEMSVDITYSKFLDLLSLVPEKFRESALLIAYLNAVGIYGGAWLSLIDEILYLLDPYSVDVTYIDKLAGNIGLTLVRNSDTTEANLRLQIVQACEWYKMKGTYNALAIISYISKLPITIYDMYTKDYAAFVKTPWFVGEEGENPSDLDSTYYKSPHFTLEVLLGINYGTDSSSSGGGGYLWDSTLFNNLSQQIEEIRPVNTVPHYEIVLQPDTDETGNAVETNYNILTAVSGSWVFSRRHFDTSLNFDDSIRFDWTYDTFINNITIWKLGTGNKGISPDSSAFTGLETIVLTGTVTPTIYADYIEFDFTVASGTVQTGLSELGLYLSDGTTLVCASTFPDIDKHSGVVLRIRLRIYN
jgi:hypothetical protein